jgi:CRISPR-associated protein Cmr2
MDNIQKHLFVCAVGPVQDFIATARTSQDLRFGSWLLSELSKAAAAQISAAEPHQLIFPPPGQNLTSGSRLNVANKVVAVVAGEPQNIAREVLNAIKRRLEQIYKETYSRIDDRVNCELVRKQRRDLIEFYWASALYTDERAYKTARREAEAVLAARKNTRNFEQVTGCEGVPKSSLDGVRESVLPENTKSMDEETLYTAYRAEPGEVLSGVDLLKRWGDIRGTSFPSTTDVAALPFCIMLGQEREVALRKCIQTLLKKYTERKETLGTYFYSDRLAQLIPDKRAWREFQHRFAQILKQADINQQPSPYYALLLADGDNMGKTINAQARLKDHQSLSQKLSEFASTAHRLITDYRGTPIYAGGDDVLAYLPLHTVLRCVADLDREFSQAMSGFTFTGDDEQLYTPTLSGAVVIAHHLTPLRDVLDIARRAEKEAKRVSGKNTLVIVSSKRGSGDRVVSAKLNALIERLSVLIEYVRQRWISTGTAYELEQIHQQLRAAELLEVIQREALRIIQHKREGGGEQEIQKQVRQQFEMWFKDTDLKLDELAQEMVIANQFARAYELADVTMTEKETQL